MRLWKALPLIVGVWLGLALAEPGTEYVVEERTVTKEVPVEVEVPATVPSACFDAIRYGEELAKAGIKIDDASYKQLDIISDGRQALAEGGTNELNRLETRQRRMESDTLGAVQTIAELQPLLNDRLSACMKELHQ